MFAVICVGCISGHKYILSFTFFLKMGPIKCDLCYHVVFYLALNLSIPASPRGAAHSWTSMGDEMGAKVEVKEGSGGVGGELKC